jgi:hypothetical protein
MTTYYFFRLCDSEFFKILEILSQLHLGEPVQYVPKYTLHRHKNVINYIIQTLEQSLCFLSKSAICIYLSI